MTLRIPRLLAPVFATLALAFGGFAFAAPPQLLLPHDMPEEKAGKAEKSRAFSSEGHRVQLNRAFRDLKRGDAMQLTLPNGKSHAVTVDMVQEHGGGDTTFYGHIKDAKGHKQRVVITSGPAGSYGRIVTPDGDFRIVPGDGHDWLVDMVEEQVHIPIEPMGKDYKVVPSLPKAGNLSTPEYQERIAGVNAVEAADATPTPQVVVDLMIVYSPAYSTSLGSGLTTRLNNLVANMNTYLADSEVAITLRLVHSAVVSAYSTDTTQSGVGALEAITYGTSPFSGIAALRNSVGADMVMFLRNGGTGSGSGIAWVANRPIDASFGAYTYSVVTGCLTLCDWVHMHELGHNMGLMHDRHTSTWENGGVPPGPGEEGSHPYAYGYASCQGGGLVCDPVSGLCGSQPECSTSRTGTNNFSDIMAYFHGSTTRNLKFSNPNVMCAGALGINTACGIASGGTSADAARAMNDNRVALSALRASTSGTATSSTALASSQNPSYVGQAVTFTATVTGGSGLATGTVTFRDGGATISGCSGVALNASAAATCTTASLAQGTRTITAVYSGSSTYAGSTSAGLSQGVAARTTPTVSLSSSRNPASYGSPINFTASVSGSAGTATGTITFRDNGSPIGGCTNVAMSGGGASCTAGLIPAGIHSVTASYNGNVAYNPAVSAEIAQSITEASNLALATAGTVATASSVAAGYPVTSVNDNVRSGINWGTSGGWQDNTFSAYPDWVQLQFNGQKVLDRVVVYTLSNSYGIEPTDSTLATTYGLQSFTVEGWTGSAWQVLATVTGNTLAKRTVTFPNFTTDRIRINVTAAAYYMSRIVEIEAWGINATAPGPTLPPTNVALASTGAVATASSVAAGYPVASVIDNVRSGINWGTNGGWQDNTFSAYPDWVQVQFNGNKSIDRVVVYTLSNTYGTEPTDSTLATTYGVQNFTVEAWIGSSWQVVGTVTGNTLARRIVTFPAVTTDRIRINVTAAAYYMSRIVEIEAWGVEAAGGTPPTPPSNVALATAGATASASSLAAGYPIATVIDNVRSGLNWGTSGGWQDNTFNAYPDWVQVQFNGTKSIDRVVVYTLSNSYGTEPTDATLATTYGLQNFTVEGWNGTSWQVLGTVTGNTLAKRTVTFPAFSTDRIRVNVTAAAYYMSRIVEIEAWGN